ncbi:MAG: hypothetical protein M3Z11_03730 [Candidatus Dormibacteraeota bacterium]|nr:hypothetical protein [Candidatus Dormibacteraeota bacterium]
MWPFRRKPEAHTDSQRTLRVPVMRQEWKQLPALQRTIGEHPLTAPPVAFAADLVTHQDPSVTSGPLGHDVTREAPAGLVMGLVSASARPSTRNDGPAMIHRPRVQRQAAVSSDETLDDHGAEASGPDQDSLALAETVREVPVVASQPVVQRLTTVAPDVAPVPVGNGLVRQSRPHLQRSMTAEVENSDLTGPGPDPTSGSPDLGDASPDLQAPAGQRLTLGQSRRLGLGAPLRKVPSAAVQRLPDLPLARQTPAQTVTDAHLLEPTPVLIESTAPPPSIPASATGVTGADGADGAAGKTDNSIGSPDSPNLPSLPFESRPTLQRAALDLPLAPTGRAQAAEAPALVAGEAGDAGALAGWPATLAPTESLITSTSRMAQWDGTAASPIQRLAEPETARPTAAAAKLDRPLLQRRAASPGDEMTPGPSRWSPQAGPAIAAIGAPLTGTRSLASLQRVSQQTVAAPSERATPAPAQAIVPDFSVLHTERGPRATQATTFVQTSSVDIPASPGAFYREKNSMPGLALGSMPQSFQSRQSAPAVQRMPLQSQAQPPPRPVERPDMSLPLAPVASVASVQRATQIAESAIAVASQPMITAQRDSFASEPPWQASETSVQGATASSAATSSATGPSGAAHPDENLDALAGKLYDRIRNRLKSELLLDRERAGLLTDLRS